MHPPQPTSTTSSPDRQRPGLDDALTGCREGETLVGTELDRIARSIPDASAISDDETERPVAPSLGVHVYDPTDTTGWLRRKKAKLSPNPEAYFVPLHAAGEHSISDRGEHFSTTRSTAYVALRRTLVVQDA